MKKYKVLTKDGHSLNRLKKNWKVGEWYKEIRVELGYRGLHWTTQPYMWLRHTSDEIYECETQDDLIEFPNESTRYQSVSRGMRLIRKCDIEVEFPELFAIRQFLDEVVRTPFFQPSSQSPLFWNIFAQRWNAPKNWVVFRTLRDASEHVMMNYPDAVDSVMTMTEYVNYRWLQKERLQLRYDLAHTAQIEVRSALYNYLHEQISLVANVNNSPAREVMSSIIHTAQEVVECMAYVELMDDRAYLHKALNKWQVWREGYGLYAERNGKLFVYRKIEG